LTESEEKFLLFSTSEDVTDDVMEVYSTEDGLSYIDEDLVRRGPSGRLCVEDDESLVEDMPPLRIVVIVEDSEDDIEIIEPDIIYLMSVVNIDLTNE
jgi:hypothetical protein